ncbi:dynamin family protein [Phytohabitans flavus]|uniref:Dynamin n=1 Tax=Phytohabitans flavus TaxID=1076124 RepID=A0A6F8XT66_9ACTN|nr:dynamin family protein [Phytohabitans flavus]BCB76941.1 dynamin [Phytohabitans flavus]
MSTAVEAPSIVQRVLGHANDVHALAKRYGRDDLAAVLAAEAGRWTEATATIVVAGAQKRGKSRLVNAVVERPDLVPVDVDIATHTYLSMRRGPSLTATVQRREGGEVVSLPVEPDEIADYASAAGDPTRMRDVVGVEITVDHPVLDGVRLVDTPGVDSLTLGHRHTTVAMLREADALLFVLSAQDQPVLRHELEFLAEAAQGIRAIAFVLTKVEDSSSWQGLLEENKRRLAAFAAGLPDGAGERLLNAPWIPVSAKLADASSARRAAGATARADELWTRSGMERLVGYLRACAAGRELARCGRVLSGTVSVLRALAVAQEDRRAAASQDAETVKAKLAEVEATLQEVSQRARERHRLAVDNQFLGREVATLVRQRLDEARRPYDAAVAELTTPTKVDRFLAELPDSVERSLEAVWSTLTAEVQDRVTAVLTDFLAAMGLDPIDIDLAKLQMPPAVRARLDLGTAPTNARFDMLREGVPGLAIAASLTSLLLPLTGPFAFVVGPAVALGVTHRRHQWERAGRSQNGVRRALAEAFAGGGAEMTMTLERAIARWRGEAEQAVDAALAAQRREQERRRTELVALSARDEAARKEAVRVAGERLAALARHTARAEALSTEVGAEVDRLAG